MSISGSLDGEGSSFCMKAFLLPQVLPSILLFGVIDDYEI